MEMTDGEQARLAIVQASMDFVHAYQIQDEWDPFHASIRNYDNAFPGRVCIFEMIIRPLTDDDRQYVESMSMESQAMMTDPRMRAAMEQIARTATPEYLALLRSMGYLAENPAPPPQATDMSGAPVAPVLSPMPRPTADPAELALAKYFGLQ